MEQYGFKSMSVDFGKAQNPVQHDPILMTRLLSDNSTIRDKHLCHVRMMISYLVEGNQTVTIEHLDENTHSRDIEESFRVKKPTMLLNLLRTEAAKNYSASHI